MSIKSIGRPLMVFRLILIINIVLSLLCFQHMPEFYLFSFRACLKNALAIKNLAVQNNIRIKIFSVP